MATSTIKHTQTDTEIDNVVCCLEFLAGQAMEKELSNIHVILRQAIRNITKNNASYKKSRSDYSDIMNAFIFFVEFCLTEDPKAKKQVLKFIDSINNEDMQVN